MNVVSRAYISIICIQGDNIKSRSTNIWFPFIWQEGALGSRVISLCENRSRNCLSKPRTSGEIWGQWSFIEKRHFASPLYSVKRISYIVELTIVSIISNKAPKLSCRRWKNAINSTYIVKGIYLRDHLVSKFRTRFMYYLKKLGAYCKRAFNLYFWLGIFWQDFFFVV